MMWDSNEKYHRAAPSISPSAKYPPRQLLKLSFALLLVCYTLFVMFSEIHSRTYVWQSTVLPDYIYTDLRTSCDYASTEQTLPSTSGLKTQPKLKIGIIVLYGKGAVGEWGDDVMKQVLNNRHTYANLHGYDIINANTLIDPSRPVAWSKILAIQYHLPNYDYVMYIDMDAVIMQPSITVESLIYATKESAEADIVIQSDWNGANTGIWMAKNTAWTKEFLQLAWDQKQLVPKTSGNYSVCTITEVDSGSIEKKQNLFTLKFMCDAHTFTITPHIINCTCS